eukprot:2360468-Alexandrium_andersonii.AAC.1
MCIRDSGCTGQNGFMQRAMIDASRKSGPRKPVAREANRDKWVEFQELAGSAQEPLWRLAQE